MKETRRVVITQVNTKGRSSLLAEKHVERSGVGVFNFWQTFPDRSPDDALGLDSEFKFFPEAGGTHFKLFVIPPEDPSAEPERTAAAADNFFEHIGWEQARRDTARHPMMHITPTVDYILLLSGKVSLVLDVGDPIALEPFDAVVQRGTNHSWVNTGDTTALLMSVLIGSA
jgi:hypothetical protein